MSNSAVERHHWFTVNSQIIGELQAEIESGRWGAESIGPVNLSQVGEGVYAEGALGERTLERAVECARLYRGSLQSSERLKPLWISCFKNSCGQWCYLYPSRQDQLAALGVIRANRFQVLAAYRIYKTTIQRIGSQMPVFRA